MTKVKNTIVSDEELTETKNSAILGHYEGECADANITNLNGLDITREVWEHVFESDEYKKAITSGWYIGYLGHPQDDPDCQDFRKACIVMREGHIDNNGKVYGKFDLIDTPVGRIVKAFQDAGVVFGISVRGAGDIIQNSVDPDTFIFRGFDLVTFPAFPESIPTFIAASTDVNQRQKYQAVCAAIKENMDALDTVQSVEIVQSCFAKQSDEYKMLEDQKQKIQSCDEVAILPEAPGETAELAGELAEAIAPAEEAVPEQIPFENPEASVEIDPRVESMTKLYLDLKEKYDTLALEHKGLQAMYDNLVNENSRKFASIERITTSQINDLHKVLSNVEASLKIKTEEADSLKSKLSQTTSKLKKVQASLDTHVQANGSLRQDIQSLNQELANKKEENLKYKERIDAAQATIKSKEAIISSVKSELDETVRKHALELKSANRADEIASMKSKVAAAESLVKDYQEAYAHIYASAVGARLPNLESVSATTSVARLQKMIRTSVSLPMKPDILEPTQDVDPSYFDADDYDNDDLVTL